MQVGQAIHEFVSSLELTEGQRDEASRQHTFLREQLASRLPLDPRFNTFLTGSYARSTAVRPLKDIDVFCVLQRTADLAPESHAPAAALQRVKGALDAAYPGKAADPQNRSVNIEFTGTGIGYDVVPAYVADGGGEDQFLIPDLAAGVWIRSNPRVHRERSVVYNAQTEGELKPLTKALKHWNRALPDGQRLRSFHLEVMAWSVLTSKPASRLAGLATLFRGLAVTVLTPTPDPAGLGPDLDADVRPETRNMAAVRFEAVAREIDRAAVFASSGHTEVAHHILFGIFGDPYPERGKPESGPGSRVAVVTAPDSGSRFG